MSNVSKHKSKKWLLQSIANSRSLTTEARLSSPQDIRIASWVLGA